MTQVNPVGSTALLIANLRAAESGRGDALFDDPFAKHFSVPGIDERAREWSARWPLFPACIRVRTRWLDDVLVRELDSGTTQVVVLGAGCCSRAMRFSRPGVTYYEVDQPDVLQFKAEHLASAGIANAILSIAADYTNPGLVKTLTSIGLDPLRRTLVIWEGNTYYLHSEQIAEVVRLLAQSLSDLVLAFDYVTPELIAGESRSPTMREAIRVFPRVNAPWRGSIADVQALAAKVGLRVVEDELLEPKLARMLPHVELGPNAQAEMLYCVLETAVRS